MTSANVTYYHENQKLKEQIAKLTAVADDDWTDEWPTEKGTYWFHGWPFGKNNGFNGEPTPPVTSIVKAVRNGSGTITLVMDGHFFYQSEGAVGKFRKAVLPEPPAEPT